MRLTLWAGGAAIALGAGAYWMRDELQRYRRILQADKDPNVVGASVTPQGNKFALDMSDEQRRRKRVEPT